VCRRAGTGTGRANYRTALVAGRWNRVRTYSNSAETFLGVRVLTNHSIALAME